MIIEWDPTHPKKKATDLIKKTLAEGVLWGIPQTPLRNGL